MDAHTQHNGSTDWDTLITEVKAWGQEKGINNAYTQFAKITEELGELAHELTRGQCDGENPPSDASIDAIGDVLVTVILFARIAGIDLKWALQEAYDTIKERKGVTVNGNFRKEE